MRRVALLTVIAMTILGCLDVSAPDTRPSQRSEGVFSEAVHLVVGTESLEHGDTLEAVLANATSGVIGYNLCSTVRERRTTGGEWEQVESLRICTAALYDLKPGERARWREPVDPGWGEGTFRIAVPVYAQGRGNPVAIRSEAFAVVP